MPLLAALIGDLVGSRTAGDRAALHAAMLGAIDRINAELGPVTPVRITVGDEYQGCFATVGEALRAALRLRLALLPDVDVRHGVGWGRVTVLSDEPRVEDGPAWWAARTAIEEVAAAQARSASRSLRTAFRRAEDLEGPDEGPDEAAVNAALVARDALLASAGRQSLSVLAGMLAGMSQQQIAARLGVTPSAVSQRVRRDGLAALVRSDELLGSVR
jgi:DNA-binding transcriptional LysR family regulator